MWSVRASKVHSARGRHTKSAEGGWKEHPDDESRTLSVELWLPRSCYLGKEGQRRGLINLLKHLTGI